MARAAVAPRTTSTVVLLSIGQVLAKLSPEFPDLSPSKLRFLEESQLITPSRTESGYRKFSPTDLDRLRFVLTMQRDHYLPLKVIKGYLDDLDAGRTPNLPGAVQQKPSMLSSERKLSRAELIREAGASVALLDDAVAASLMPAGESYTDESLVVLRSLVDLQRSGIEPRHMRGFRAAAEREVGLIESALLPVARKRDVTSKARAAELAREISGQLEIVRASLLRSALSRLDS